MSIEESIDISVSPDVVMACYKNVPDWPRWDPDTREATIDGPFQAGARGRLRPAKGFAVPMRFVHVTDTSFTVEAFAPFCTLRFEHELVSIAIGTRATHRVTFEGPLAFIFERLVGSRVRLGLPVTMASLKKWTEQMA